MQQDRVLRHVERHAEEEVARALIHHQAELSFGDEELEERVAGGQAGLVQLSRVPRGDHVTPARRVGLERVDDVRQLIDMSVVWRDPVAPLLTVVAAGISLETRLRYP